MKDKREIFILNICNTDSMSQVVTVKKFRMDTKSIPKKLRKKVVFCSIFENFSVPPIPNMKVFDK